VRENRKSGGSILSSDYFGKGEGDLLKNPQLKALNAMTKALSYVQTTEKKERVVRTKDHTSTRKAQRHSPPGKKPHLPKSNRK